MHCAKFYSPRFATLVPWHHLLGSSREGKKGTVQVSDWFRIWDRDLFPHVNSELVWLLHQTSSSHLPLFYLLLPSTAIIRLSWISPVIQSFHYCVTMFDIFRNKFRPSSFVINMQIFRPGYQAIVQMTNKIIFQVFPTTAIHYNTTGNSVCWDFSEFF